MAIFIYPVVRAVLQLSVTASLIQWVTSSRDIRLGCLFIGVMALAGVQVVRSRSQVPREEWSRGDWLDLGLVMFGMAASASIYVRFSVGAAGQWTQGAIPFVGLILGNSLSALAVSLDHLRHALRSHQSRIEARLILGASVSESIAPHLASALRAGMGPILSSMSGAGLVSIPGALSGQLLAGTDPKQAVKMQLLVLGGICLASGSASALLLNLWIRRRIDWDREAFRPEVFA